MKAFCGPTLAFSWVFILHDELVSIRVPVRRVRCGAENRLQAAVGGSSVTANPFGSPKTEKLHSSFARGGVGRAACGGPPSSRAAASQMCPLAGPMGFLADFVKSSFSTFLN